MMNKMNKIFLGLLTMASVSAIKAQTYDDLNKIEVNGNVHIVLIPSGTCKIEANKDVSVEVSGNYVEFNTKGPNPQVSLQLKSLKVLDLSGACQAKMEGTLTTNDDISIEANGASKADLNLKAPKIVISAAGASQVRLSGSGEMINADISGASKVFAADFIANQATIETAGASEATIYAQKSIAVDASGASKVNYSGSPGKREIDASGLSKIYADGKLDESKEQVIIKSGDMPELASIPELNVKNTDDTVTISIGKKQLLVVKKEIKSDDCDTCVKIKKQIIINESKNDSPKIIKEETIVKKENNDLKKNRKIKNVWEGIELGFDNLTTSNYNLNIPAPQSFLTTRLGSSYHFAINLFESNFNIVKGRLAIASGLGIEHISFRMDQDSVLDANASSVKPRLDITQKLNSNRFTLTNFNVPLLLKYNSSPDRNKKRFHIAAGVIGTWDPYATLYWTSTANSYEEKHEYDYDNKVNPFRLSATVRIGYGNLKLFANYGLTPLFKSTVSSNEVHIAQVGITLISF